jgi:glycosyltransferase involved in cell wall biosynthesis
MLIGIDGRAFYGQAAGTGRYVSELCIQLNDALPNARFLVYANKPLTLPFDLPRWSVKVDNHWGAKRWPAIVWLGLRVGRLVALDGVDVFWGAANFLPLGLPSRVRSVLTVYDFVHRLFPQTQTWRNKISLHTMLSRSISNAGRVVSISQGTADKLFKYHGRKTDAVVRPAASPLFVAPSDNKLQQWRLSSGVPARYVLSVSTLEPRKNLNGLLEAMLMLRSKGLAQNHALVLVGQLGWHSPGLTKRLEQARAQGLDIVLPGRVLDLDLPLWYAGAEVVVMPSIYEGFGIPVLEAARCGAKVVASDVPEMREAGGEWPIYVSPDPEGISDGIWQAISGSGPAPGPRPTWSWESEGLRMAQVLMGKP